jgi:putative oxidoreductase
MRANLLSRLGHTSVQVCHRQTHYSEATIPILSMLNIATRLEASRWFFVPLRLIVGFGFMEHGYAKLARGPQDFIQILHALGTPMPEVLGWATILVELFGGAAVLLGALVPLASIPMTVVLVVAILTVHLPNGFSSIKLQAVTPSGARFGQPGYETDLLYLACLVALVFAGPGPLSIDRLIKRAWAKPA